MQSNIYLSIDLSLTVSPPLNLDICDGLKKKILVEYTVRVKMLATFDFFHTLHLMVAFAQICYLKYVTARCGQFKGHIQLWDRVDLDTFFLKRVQLNLKSKIPVEYI